MYHLLNKKDMSNEIHKHKKKYFLNSFCGIRIYVPTDIMLEKVWYILWKDLEYLTESKDSF